MKDHIRDNYCSNVGTTDDTLDNCNDGSFNGDDAELSFEEEDLSDSEVNEKGKLEEKEVADQDVEASYDLDGSGLFDCAYDTIDHNGAEDDSGVVVVDDFIGKYDSRNECDFQPLLKTAEDSNSDLVHQLNMHIPGCGNKSYCGNAHLSSSDFSYMEVEGNCAYYAQEHNEHFGGLCSLAYRANNPRCQS